MQQGMEPSAARRRRRTAIIVAGLLILLGLSTLAIPKLSSENGEPPTLVVRVDDIQDFAFREAQLFLLRESMTNNVPLSLAVIVGVFGEDREIVQAVKLAVNSGSEVGVHGWKHEDLARVPFNEQVALLTQSKNRLREVFDLDPSVLIPPMFSYNEDTIAAMRQASYNIMSTSFETSDPGLIGEVMSLPATVELSKYSNGAWNMKSMEAIKTEISRSVQKYGFAIIVTHPQEFMADGNLIRENLELYRILLSTLRKNYSFTTLERLSENRG